MRAGLEHAAPLNLFLAIGVLAGTLVVSIAQPVEAASLDPEKVPFVAQTEANTRAVENHIKAKTHKAIAIGKESGFLYSVVGGPSVAEVSRRALQNCEWSNRAPCFLYAVDGVINPTINGRYEAQPSIRYDLTAFDPNEIPFVSDASQKAIAQGMAAASEGRVFAAAVYRTFYAWARRDTAEAARTDALRICREKAKADCVLYWLDTKMVMDDNRTQNLAAIKVRVPLAGQVYEGFYPLPDGKQVALPEGKWTFIGDDLGRSSISDKQTHRIVLANAGSSTGVWEIEIDFTEGTQVRANMASGFMAAANCERKDWLSITRITNSEGGRQDCWFVSHQIMSYPAAANITRRKGLSDFYEQNSIPYPRTLIGVFHHFANSRNSLQVGYLFNPATEEIRPDASRVWASSDWHVANFQKDAAKVPYLEKLRAWGEKTHPSIKVGFEGNYDKSGSSKLPTP